jgi:hypothetical protein
MIRDTTTERISKQVELEMEDERITPGPQAAQAATTTAKRRIVSLTQSTPFKLTIGTALGALIPLAVWFWNRLDARIDSKADARELSAALEQIAKHNERISAEEARVIELRVKREIDDRETVERDRRDANDKAEIKASLRRIEDTIMRGGK